jgi:excisionase family DNA binding protein
VDNQVLTVKEAAEYLKVSESAIYSYCGDKNFPATQISGKWRLHKGLLEEWFFPQLRHRRSASDLPLDEKKYITVLEAAEILGLAVKDAHKICFPYNPAIKLDNLGLLSRKALDKWVANNKPALDDMKKNYYKDDWMRRNFWNKVPPEGK